jgi:hypothetical protein
MGEKQGMHESGTMVDHCPSQLALLVDCGSSVPLHRRWLVICLIQACAPSRQIAIWINEEATELSPRFDAPMWGA